MTGTIRPSTAEDVNGALKGGAGDDSPLSRLKLIRWSDFSLVPVILVLMLIGFIVSPVFLTSDNLISVVQQSSELSLLVLGQALILICGRMDLSLESTIGIAPVVAMWLVLPSEEAASPASECSPPGRRSRSVCWSGSRSGPSTVS